MININATEQKSPFSHIRFFRAIENDIFSRCQQDAQRFPYYKIEKTRTSNPNRIWLNQQSGYLSAIAYEFDRNEMKRHMSHELRIPLWSCRTRAELCLDSVGSWLEPHKDDAAKLMTLQLYLTDYGTGTSLGDEKTQVIANSGWAFNNADQPVHSLQPLKYNRASIIINYVTDDWRDKSVLV